MKRFKSFFKRNKYTLTAVIFFIAVLAFWEVYVRIKKIEEYVFPALSDVAKAFGELLKDKAFYSRLTSTIWRIVLSLFWSIALGALFGLIGGLNRYVKAILKPFIALMKSIPVMAITLVLLLSFGGQSTPVIIGFLMAFPVIYSQTVYGIESIDKDLIEITDTMKGSILDKTVRVYVPLMTPSFLQGLLVSGGLCIKAVISAEIISRTVNSLGNAMFIAKADMFEKTPELFAYCIVALLLTLFFELIVFALKRLLVRW